MDIDLFFVCLVVCVLYYKHYRKKHSHMYTYSNKSYFSYSYKVMLLDQNVYVLQILMTNTKLPTKKDAMI